MVDQEKDKSNYIYFTINRPITTKELTIILPEGYQGAEIKDIYTEKGNSKFISFERKVYRSKIIPNYFNLKKEIVIKAVADDSAKKEDCYIIKIFDDKEDFYEYEFKLGELDVVALKQKEQFDIFLKSLEKTEAEPYKRDKKEAFIKCSLKYVSEKQREKENAEIESEFYFSLFLEACKSSKDKNKLVNEIILLFEPEKIKGIKNLPEDLVSKIKAELEKLTIDEENKDLSKAFYNLLLCFYFFFDNDKIIPMLEKSDKILYSLSDKLEVFPKLFGSFILSKKIIDKLILKSESFEQVLNFLFFVQKDLKHFVEVLVDEKNNEKIQSLLKNYKDSKKKEKEMDETKGIFFWNYFEPSIDKEINSILENVKTLKGIVDIEKFLSTCLEKSEKIGMNLNLDTLIAMKDIFNQLNIHSGDNYDKILDSIHSNFLKLIELEKLKNIEVLNKLEKAQYKEEKKLIEKASNSLDDVLKGIDINLLKKDKNKEQFFKKFKEIFPKIFGKNYGDKVISLIDRMEDFHLLNEFFDENSYFEASIIVKKYLDLIPTCDPNNFGNIIQLTVDLICKNYAHKAKILEGIEKLLDLDTTVKIYINLIEKNKQDENQQKLSMEVGFLKRQKSNELTVEKILEVLKNNPAFLKYDINLPKKLLLFGLNDLFNPIETDQYRFVKGLLNDVDVKSIKESKNTDLQKIINSISTVIEDIKSLNFAYKDVILYFSENGEFKKEFKEKLGGVFKFDENFNKSEYFTKSENIMNNLKEAKKKAEIVYESFSLFFKESRKETIQQFSDFIEKIKKNKLNEPNFLETIKNFMKQHSDDFKEAEEIKEKQKSFFFNGIKESLDKKEYKDEIKFFNALNKKFSEFKNLFNSKDNKDNKINIDYEFFMKCVKNKSSEDITKELDLLAKLLKVEKWDIKKNKIVLKLMLIAKAEKIYNICLAIAKFVEILKIETEKKGLYNELRKDIKKLKEKGDINILEIWKKKLTDIGLLKEDKFENNCIDVLIILKDKPELILSLCEEKKEDWEGIEKIIEQSDERYISENDIDDLRKCIDIAKKIFNTKMPFSTFLEKLKQVKITSEDVSSFENIANKYFQIKRLKSSVFQSSNLKGKIEKFLKKAEILLGNKKENLICEYENQYLNKKQILSLKERVFISKANLDVYHYFSERIAEILDISNILEELFKKGYPEKIEIKIHYKINESNDNKNNYSNFFIYNGKKSDYYTITKILNEKLTDLKETQIVAYQKEPLIRYIYGRQFKYLYDYFNNIGDLDIKPLLSYIINNSNVQEIKEFYAQENQNKEEIAENLINYCTAYLKKFLNNTFEKYDLDTIYQNSLLKLDNKMNKRIYIYHCEEKNSKKKIYQFFAQYTGGKPIAQNILLFNEEITTEELTAFIYRAILCKYETLFVIENGDCYNNEKLNFMYDLLEELYNKNVDTMKSSIIITYLEKNSPFYKKMNVSNFLGILNNFEFKENFKYKINGIEVVSSDSPGVGKSTYIKNYIEKKKKKRIYFPIGGTMNTDKIIKRLKNAKIDNECILHLELQNTNQIDLMNEFLFSLSILRFYGRNDKIYFLPNNVEIKIEIPNEFIDYFKKFNVLDMFEQKKLSIKELDSLKVSGELGNEIQLVTDYLKILKNEKLNEPKSEELILEKIKEKIEHPNYYEINSFIKILSLQLKKYKETKTQILENTENRILIDYFIEISILLSERAFSTLSLSPISSSSFGQYDEVNSIVEINNKISKCDNKKISFNTIGDYLLVFKKELKNQSGNNGYNNYMSIIHNFGNPIKKKDNKKKENLKGNLKNLKKSRYKKFIKFIDSKNFIQKDFLNELKQILGVDNPVEDTNKDKKK